MKKNLTLFFSFLLVLIANAQTKSVLLDSLQGFSLNELNGHLQNFKGTEKEKQLYIEHVKRAYINRKYKIGNYAPPVISKSKTLYNNQILDSLNCTNIDFEAGNTNGWAVTGDYTIVSSGVDIFGGFNKVYAGNYSLMLSSNDTNTSNFQSSLTRIISVPILGQTFFNLHFALDLLDYPHTQTSAAKFYITFYDSAGTALSCQDESYYFENFTGGTSIVGYGDFQQTWGNTNVGDPTDGTGPGINCYGEHFPVTYTSWKTIAMDLTPYAGQNVTCKIECDWCIYNLDWAYCYIDADCPNSVNTADTTLNCLAGTNGIQTKNKKPEFKIYPNPTKQILTIESSMINENTEIQITDVLGNLVKQLFIRSKQSSINVSELNSGVYFIKVGNNTQKFIKE